MIFKAAEDFKKRTLSALPTLVEKLAYICSLQTSGGSYVHWGFARAFGNRPTQEAIHTAHADAAREHAGRSGGDQGGHRADRVGARRVPVHDVRPLRAHDSREREHRG